MPAIPVSTTRPSSVEVRARYAEALDLRVGQLGMRVDEGPSRPAPAAPGPARPPGSPRHVASSLTCPSPFRRPSGRHGAVTLGVSDRGTHSAPHEHAHQVVLVLRGAVGVRHRLAGIRGGPTRRREHCRDRGGRRPGRSAALPRPAPARRTRRPSRPRRAPGRCVRPATSTRQLTVTAGRSWNANRRCAMPAPGAMRRHLDRDQQLARLQRRRVGPEHEVGERQAAALVAASQDHLGIGGQQERGRVGVRVRERQVAAQRAGAPDADVGHAPLHRDQLRPAGRDQSASARSRDGVTPAPMRRTPSRTSMPDSSAMGLMSTRCP